MFASGKFGKNFHIWQYFSKNHLHLSNNRKPIWLYISWVRAFTKLKKKSSWKGQNIAILDLSTTLRSQYFSHSYSFSIEEKLSLINSWKDWKLKYLNTCIFSLVLFFFDYRTFTVKFFFNFIMLLGVFQYYIVWFIKKSLFPEVCQFQ